VPGFAAADVSSSPHITRGKRYLILIFRFLVVMGHEPYFWAG
jgi:hypothetical protein